MNTIWHTVASSSVDLKTEINALSINAILIASLILVVLLGIASQVVKRKSAETLKLTLFIAIAATIILPSLFLIGSTIYLNTISESSGPVHWHADIEFWVCGQEVELRNPTGFLSNKIGTSTYHEHNDKRIHLEGVVMEKSYDASLKKFMDVTDGSITDTSLVIATEDYIFEDDIDGDTPRGDQEFIRNSFFSRNNDGRAQLSMENGQTCDDDQPGEVQVFVYDFNKDDDTYTQTKLEDITAYTIRDDSVVPPGDCIIVEFDRPKLSTDRLCKQYGVRDTQRCTEFGVTQFDARLCNHRFILSDEQKAELEAAASGQSYKSSEDTDFQEQLNISPQVEGYPPLDTTDYGQDQERGEL
jgi:hypothetical protein